MENVLLIVWLVFVLVIIAKMYSLWRIIKSIDDRKVRRIIIDNLKEYIFFKSFPKNIDLNLKGVLFRKMYNSNNIISLVIFILIIILTFTSNIHFETRP